MEFSAQAQPQLTSMEAHVKCVREILHSGDQFLVPFFQRHYRWQKENWERLLNDIIALAEEEETRHFLGPLVCTPFHPVPGEGVTPYQLIDGQQRLMTITLALAALRDVAKLSGLEDVAAEIHEDFLIHRRRQGLQRLKVVPRVEDRLEYEEVIDGTAPISKESCGIIGAYSFFKREWKKRTAGDSEAAVKRYLAASTARLSIVAITITADRENPFEIFESLNATGLALEESDLIRNFLFMQVPLEEQASFHNSHWETFEDLFAAREPYEKLPPTAFYRSYLMRNGSYCRDKATYVEFKRQSSTSGLSPVEHVRELRRFAKFELWLRRPSLYPNTGLSGVATEIQSLDTTTAHPLLLNLLDREQRGALSREEVLGCFRDVASFVIRRAVCGESTRGYGRLFPEAVRGLHVNARQDLQHFLLENRWPDDAAFLPALVEFPLYKRARNKCRLLLEKLERHFGGNEQVDLDRLSIEHVLPQTLGDDEEGHSWRTALGYGDWRTLHEKWGHTLGNLTLTGYNAELSNGSFAEKHEAFAESRVALNKHFLALEDWGAETIKGRGLMLARVVAQLWPRPPGGPAYVPLGPTAVEQPEAETPSDEDETHVTRRARGQLRVKMRWSLLEKALPDEVICDRTSALTLAKFFGRLISVLDGAASEGPIVRRLTHMRVSKGFPLSDNPRGFLNPAQGEPYAHALVPGTALYVCTGTSNQDKVSDIRRVASALGLPEGSVEVSLESSSNLDRLLATLNLSEGGL